MDFGVLAESFENKEKDSKKLPEEEIFEDKKKDKVVGVVFTFIFGPIGYLYSGRYGLAAIYILIAIIFSWTIVAPIVIWLICLLSISGDIERYNKNLEVEYGAKIQERKIREKQLKSKEKDDIPSQIKKLKELKDSGAITDKDFNRKKKELLDKM